MRFCILGSGSSGNSGLLQTEGARVLVDAGFSARKLGQLLAAAGTALEHIDAVFLTHEHGDHAAAIEGLKKFPHIRVFANAATARAVQTGLGHRPDWQIFETGGTFRFRDLEVRSFAVPHDASEPGHQPFCAPLEQGAAMPSDRMAALKSEAHTLAERLTRLDRQSRELVRTLARDGESAC